MTANVVFGPPYIHPTALVESTEIGEGAKIWAFAHVMAGVRIGKRSTLGDHSFIDRDARIGDDVTIKQACLIAEGVTIEDGAFIGPGVIFTDDRVPRSPRLDWIARRYVGESWRRPPVVGYAASIGAGAVIMPGTRVGPFAIVGAGALIVRDVPAHVVVIGLPGAHAGFACACGLKRGGLDEFGVDDGPVAPGVLRCAACVDAVIPFKF